MTVVPSNCTACGTSIPRGATRCPGCGRVFGEANRCPSCNAVAAVRPSGDGFVCAACGAPRSAGPGVQVMGGTGLVPSHATKNWAKSVAVSGGSIGLRLAGVASAGASFVVGGLVALVSGTAIGLATGGFVALGGLAFGAMLFTWGRGAAKTAERMSSSADELEILALAEKLGGSLYATDVARGLGVSVAEAETRLSSMQDGTRVVAEVTPEGLIRFDFRELRARAPLQSVRIAPEAAAAGTSGAASSEVVEAASEDTAAKRNQR